VGWYRRRVNLPPPALAGQSQVFLHFEAVMANSTVFLDGARIARHESGYTPFRVDVTAAFALSGGKPLLLLVCANATVEATYGDSSDFWWYNGGGIYRNAWLTAMPQIGFIPFDGVYAPALVNVESIVLGTAAADDTGAATLLPSIEIGNNGLVEVAVRAQSFLIDPRTDQVCAWASSDHVVGAGQLLTVRYKMTVAHVLLWSPDAPALYTHQVLVRSLLDPQLATLDTLNTTIGFRHARFDPELGFFLNRRATKIRGTANHQDFAGVGVAVPDALQTFRVRALKAIGMNAWRTAHNAPTAALLEAADREGMLVWDENHRNGEYEEATTLVLRDRNHASVIIWSLCNEVCVRACIFEVGRWWHE
jgi:beta-galactosidase